MEASAGLVAGSHNRNELVVIRRDGDPGVRARFNSPGWRASVTVADFFFLSIFFLGVFLSAAEAAAAAEWAGVPDLRRRRRTRPRRGALRGLQRVRLPRLPGLLRVRAPGGHAELPPVQDPLQAPQGCVPPTRKLRPPKCSSGRRRILHCLASIASLNFHFAGCARVPGDEEEDGVDDLENEFNWDGTESQYGAESLHGHMTYGRGGDLNGVQQPFQLNPNVPLLTNGQMVLLNQSVTDTLLT